MDLKSFRESRGLSLEQLAIALGLNSKGYLSEIEGGRKLVPIRLALQIEAWSDGALRATWLLNEADAALLEAAIARARLPEAAPA